MTLHIDKSSHFFPKGMKTTTPHNVYLNGRLLNDVVWADSDTGLAELFEHTCSRLHPPERILDPDNPRGYRTLIVQGQIRIDEIPYPAPAPPSESQYGWNDCRPCCWPAAP